MSQYIVIDFTDQQGNLLPQFEINSVLSDSDISVLGNMLQNGFSQAQNQIKIRVGTVSNPPIQTASQVYQQVVNAMNQIAFLPANAGAGTTQSSSFVGQIPGQNVIFDLNAGNGLTLNRVILTSADYTLLVTNAQANVAVSNVSSTTAAANLTYDRLETQIQLSGVQSIPSSQSSGLTNTGSGQVYSVTVQNGNKTRQTFVLSQSDYIQLYSTQLSSIVSSTPVIGSPNSTLSGVLTFIAGAVQTPPTSNPIGSSSSSTSVSTTQPQPVSQPNTLPIAPGHSPAPVNTNQAVELDIVANDGTPRTFVLTPSDAQYVLNHYTNNIKSTVDPSGIPVNSTANDVYQFLNSHLSQTNNIPPGFSPQPYTPPPTLIPGTTGQTTSTQFNDLGSIKKNPIGFIVALFTGGFAASLLFPSGMPKHLRNRKKGRK